MRTGYEALLAQVDRRLELLSEDGTSTTGTATGGGGIRSFEAEVELRRVVIEFERTSSTGWWPGGRVAAGGRRRAGRPRHRRDDDAPLNRPPGGPEGACGQAPSGTALLSVTPGDPWGAGWDLGPARSPGRCLAGIRQVVQRAASAARHLQGPESLTAQLDHLLPLVRSSYRRDPPTWTSGPAGGRGGRPPVPTGPTGRPAVAHAGGRGQMEP